jgi:hypothetical protein
MCIYKKYNLFEINTSDLMLIYIKKPYLIFIFKIHHSDGLHNSKFVISEMRIIQVSGGFYKIKMG